MALDIVKLPINDQNLAKQVEIGLAEHAKLIEHARAKDNCPLLLSLTDYYAEREFSLTEVTFLLEELNLLQGACDLENSFGIMLKNFIMLCIEAKNEGMGIALLPD